MTARVFAPKLGQHMKRKLREQARTDDAAALDDDRAFHGPGATDPGVGFYVDPSGKPQPSAGAKLWAASEVERVLGPDAIGIRLQPKSDRKRESEIATLAAEQDMDAAIDAAGGDPIAALFVEAAPGAAAGVVTWDPINDPGAPKRGAHRRRTVLITRDLFAPEHVAIDRGDQVSTVEWGHSGRRVNGRYDTFVWDPGAIYITPTRFAETLCSVLRLSAGGHPDGRKPWTIGAPPHDYRDFAENLVPALRADRREDLTEAALIALAATPAAARALVLGTDGDPVVEQIGDRS